MYRKSKMYRKAKMYSEAKIYRETKKNLLDKRRKWRFVSISKYGRGASKIYVFLNLNNNVGTWAYEWELQILSLSHLFFAPCPPLIFRFPPRKCTSHDLRTARDMALAVGTTDQGDTCRPPEQIGFRQCHLTVEIQSRKEARPHIMLQKCSSCEAWSPFSLRWKDYDSRQNLVFMDHFLSYKNFFYLSRYSLYFKRTNSNSKAYFSLFCIYIFRIISIKFCMIISVPNMYMRLEIFLRFLYLSKFSTSTFLYFYQKACEEWAQQTKTHNICRVVDFKWFHGKTTLFMRIISLIFWGLFLVQMVKIVICGLLKAWTMKAHNFS